MLYFAYGSNMNTEQMSFRCPNARIVGPHDLEGWRLAERTHADIEPDENGVVHGLLWEITEECEASLDSYEGVPVYYYKDYLFTEDGDDFILVYIMTNQSASMKSFSGFSEHYRKACRDGAIENGVEVDPLYQLMEVRA